MDPTTGLRRALADHPVQLAVFDGEIRRETGQWRIAERIAIEDVIDLFREVPAARVADDRVLLPLHETDHAELTGEVVLADPTRTPTRIEFFDFSTGERVSEPIHRMAETCVAWRLRFWTDEYDPDDPPDFLAELVSTSERASPPDQHLVQGQGEDPDTWIEAVRSAVVADRTEQRTAHRRSYAEEVGDDAISDAGGVAGLVCTDRRADEFGQQIVSLHSPADDDGSQPAPSGATELAAGDDILVCGAPDPLPVEAELFDIAGRTLDLGIYWETAAGEGVETALSPDSDHRFGVVPLVSAGPYDTVEEALRSLERRDGANAVYAGTAEIGFTDGIGDVGSERLNRNQRQAVERALAAQDLCCIQVPPWTGGRRTIHAIIRGAVDRGWTVGVFGPSEPALDSILSPVGAQESGDGPGAMDVDVARWGPEPDQSGDRWHADVIGIPLTKDELPTDVHVDLGIVDQAARIDVGRGAVPFAAADRLVVLGDTQQLPPSQSVVGETASLPPSLFAHLSAAYGAAATVELRCQYGMNQAIAMYSNAQYYDGRLIHGQENRTWSIDALPPVAPRGAVGQPRRTPTGSWHHDEAVETAVAEVESLRDRGVDPEEIALVVPTSAQIGKLRAGLEDRNLAEAGVALGRPDAFACAARSAVILTLVADPAGGHDWTPEALNVALTRAQRRLVVVANWDRLVRSGDPAADPAAALAAFYDDRGLLPTEQ